MPIATFIDVCLDASSADRLGTFWGAVLGAQVEQEPGRPARLTLPGTPTSVWVNDVPEPKTVKNRVHLDVHCADVADLLALGAIVEREPNETDHWWSLRSPDGDELCAFVRTEVPPNRLYEIVVDSADAVSQATWWADLLGGRAIHEETGSYVDEVDHLPCQFLVFGPVPEPKTAKNRVHWDVRADVEAVLERGARVLRAPTPDSGWHVLADPEGNEFCVFK